MQAQLLGFWTTETKKGKNQRRPNYCKLPIFSCLSLVSNQTNLTDPPEHLNECDSRREVVLKDRRSSPIRGTAWIWNCSELHAHFVKQDRWEKRDYNKCVLVPQTVGQLVCCMYLYSLLVLDINRLSNKMKPFIPCVGIWPGSAIHTGLIRGWMSMRNCFILVFLPNGWISAVL